MYEILITLRGDSNVLEISNVKCLSTQMTPRIEVWGIPWGGDPVPQGTLSEESVAIGCSEEFLLVEILIPRGIDTARFDISHLEVNTQDLKLARCWHVPNERKFGYCDLCRRRVCANIGR